MNTRRPIHFLTLSQRYHFEVCPSPDFASTRSPEFYRVEPVLMPKDDGSDIGLRLPTDEPGGDTVGIEWYILDPDASRPEAFVLEWELCHGMCQTESTSGSESS